MNKNIDLKITEENKNAIKRISTIIEPKQNQIDLTLGYKDFDSLSSFGYVCRVRQKGEKIWMEVKNERIPQLFKKQKFLFVALMMV